MTALSEAFDSTDAELALLSTLFASPDSVLEFATRKRLRPDQFLNRRYGALYAAIVDLADRTGGYDKVTVVAEARRAGLQQAREVADEASRFPGRAADIPRYVGVIQDSSMDRTLRLIGQEIVGDDAPSERAEKALAALMETLEASSTRRAAPIGGDLAEAVEDAASRERGTLDGVPSGFSRLDRLTGGWQDENLIILAARPGHGKSAMALQWAKSAAQAGFPVALFPLEMSRKEVARRHLAAGTGVSVSRMKRGGLSSGALRDMLEVARRDAELPLYVDDATDMSIAELRAKARRMHRRHGIRLVIIDYLQLLRMNQGKSRNDAVGEVTRGLKVLASELQLPVIALSQLSRDVEKRSTVATGKRPVLSDLRDSGNIEQDANVVLFPFREGKYDPECPEPDAVDLIVAKHRDGETTEPGDITLKWVGSAMRFDEH